jgi:hypothetical protein
MEGRGYTGTAHAHTDKDNRFILWNLEINPRKLVGIIFWDSELIGNEFEFLLHGITDY